MNIHKNPDFDKNMDKPLKKADLFSNSIGVFQGGGCKAIAYIGAYKAAREAGIMFSEVAGTSAGSIIAAMIAAGVSPEKLEELISNEDISSIPKCALNKQRKIKIIRLIQSTLVLIIVFCIFVVVLIIKFLVGLFYLMKMLFVNKNKHAYNRVSQFKSVKEIIKNKCQIIGGRIKLFVIGIYTFPQDKYGVYDSSSISELVKDWFERSGVNKDITFRDLKISLSIVSTDVSQKTAHIWNKEKTGDASVATAVAASCAIPFYFTPVNDTHVDGGVISNRPDYLYSNKPHIFNSIISFRLKSPNNESNGLFGFMTKIVDTIIDGSDSLQHSLIPKIEEVVIPVDIGATEFNRVTQEKIKELVKAGEGTVKEVFDVHVSRDAMDWSLRPKGVLKNREQTYNEVSQWSNFKYDKIIIYERTLDWVWSLYPTLISWIQNNTKVLVFSEDLDDNYIKQLKNEKQAKENWSSSEAEEYYKRKITERNSRRVVLESLGCGVEQFRKNKTKGFFFIHGHKYSGIAIQYKSESPLCQVIESKVYSDDIDTHMLRMQIDASTINEKLNKIQSKPIKIEKIDKENIYKKLKTSESLAIYKDSYIDCKKICIDELLFMNRRLRGFEYNQIKHIFDLYNEYDLELFTPVKLIHRNGEEAFMSPVIVEKHNGKLYVIDGNVRCLYAYKHGIKKLRVFVVDNVQEQLPIKDMSHCCRVDELFVTELESSGDSRYDGFVKERFRYIEKAIRE